MNSSMWLAAARQLITFVGSILVSKGLLTADQASQAADAVMTIGGGVMVLVSIGLSLRAHTAAAKVASTAALSDVQRVEVKRNAPDSVRAVAADPEQPKVSFAKAA